MDASGRLPSTAKCGLTVLFLVGALVGAAGCTERARPPAATVSGAAAVSLDPAERAGDACRDLGCQP